MKVNIQYDQYQDVGHCRHAAQRPQPGLPELHPPVGEDDQSHQDADPDTWGVSDVGGGVGLSSHQVGQPGYHVNWGDADHNQNPRHSDNFTKCRRCIFPFPRQDVSN